MWRNYLTIAWRNIVKNGVFSAINIFGLAVGLMSCILIMLFVREESGFEHWLKDNERLVRLHTAYTMPDRPAFLTVRSAGMMMPAVRDYAKNEIEDGVRLIPFGMTVRKGEDAFEETITTVDGSFFNVFDLPFIYGDPSSSFTKPMDTVITEEMALKYFGRTDVIGETLTLCCFADNTIPLTISGVIKDLPHATHLDLDILVYLQPAMFTGNDSILNTWTSVNVYTYFKMREGVSVEQLQERLTYWVNNESQFRDTMGMSDTDSDSKLVSDFIQHKIMAVPDLHLQARKDAGNMGDLSPMGDQKMISTFVIVAVLILLIACINFMNLATARASQRAREVAMRKVLGASRGQVALQFLAEAVAIVMISLLFALVAVELVLPLYNQALGRELTFELFNDLPMLFSLLAVALLVGLGAGLYPALYLSRYLPGHILKSNKSGESGTTAKLRTALVVIQFATSIGLVISTAVVFSQTNFVKSIDVGYVSDNKLILNIDSARNNLDSLKQQLVNLPEISSVVYSSEAPTQDNENNTFFKLMEKTDGQSANENQLLNYHNVGYGFFEAYEVKPIAGRLFSQSHGADMIAAPEQNDVQVNHASVVINQSALKKLGLSDPQQAIGLTLFSQNVLQDYPFELKVVGVIPDIYFRSVKFDVRPSIYMLNPQRFRVASLSFKTNDISGLMSKIETVWKNNVPMQPINLSFLSEMMAAQYESEVTEAKLFTAFSLLAILVACLGLYGLAAFTAERRTKEIGIRKIMGARVQDIVTLLIWQFSKPVLVANLIAWPLSIYAMTYWLQSFPYRIDLLWLLPICLVTGVLTLLIAWLTVGGNAAKVARANPINALRTE